MTQDEIPYSKVIVSKKGIAGEGSRVETTGSASATGGPLACHAQGFWGSAPSSGTTRSKLRPVGPGSSQRLYGMDCGHRALGGFCRDGPCRAPLLLAAC